MKDIKKFFEVSNAIEWVFDDREVELFLESYEKDRDYLEVHKDMWHLNDYCKPWVFRDYSVSVWGRKWLEHTQIKNNMRILLDIKPKNWEEVKDWHITFEHIHPFWYGNWRIGRYLMALQCKELWCLEDMYNFFLRKDFMKMRNQYYKWF